MSAQDFTLPIYYVGQIADQIGRMGADVTQWLRRSGLDEAQLADGSRSVTYPVLRQVILEALAITREPALGLLLGERLRVNTHGIVSFALMSSGTVRQTVELLERFMPLRTSLVRIRHEVRGRELRVVCEEAYPLADVQRPVLEAVVLTMKNVLDYVTMGSCNVTRVCFPFPRPDYAELAQELCRCDVRYGQSWAGFALPAKTIDLPLKAADPDAFQEAASICQRALENLNQGASLGVRVRRVMLERRNGFPSLNVTARLFHMTPRTLHRRLLDEGTSYKAILEDVRHLLAVEHLKSGRMTIQEIAYTLGYSDLANFRRAFKRWDGRPPSVYRVRSTD
jgi:AraC-like DNA-binding protein